MGSSTNLFTPLWNNFNTQRIKLPKDVGASWESFYFLFLDACAKTRETRGNEESLESVPRVTEIRNETMRLMVQKIVPFVQLIYSVQPVVDRLVGVVFPFSC